MRAVRGPTVVATAPIRRVGAACTPRLCQQRMKAAPPQLDSSADSYLMSGSTLRMAVRAIRAALLRVSPQDAFEP